ncbi:cobalt-zinc-cadmium efflux system membrane fusion protein [Dyadobacter sp. BE34]|uniref:Cobalt-zinc-cadmium efflux system membrane fusion protein n=1 Tax=Dyadobacter fermentans TaxID=94254 RepID=A0ABU1QU56_9BACT|nr:MULTISPECIES: efflux RND transporter periplasmic adaptor subunit [Dyadobacter]MDR6804691.1 cobalt-zinc-cadmium efflux system membrane fusion protein [Dyadobacter fermentans]MDR7043550.1 cobalt-zinc-cadmium efflux system membrane fusion protein [Dyadobacter sp. BE242]MDR7197862.1 cobalt-zinc-cadmium efflux system membrane fusion protein [Dyadobacter sp. BE34]MDR7214705.1 cobalt-zinc-cadmium efflux system membrane fusion protein [Dyadobacter sp. BE31]MDR7262240.1 cobalt-zinc-cadmium efflux sy
MMNIKFLLYTALGIILGSCAGKTADQESAGQMPTQENVAKLTPRQIRNAGIALDFPKVRQVSSVLRLNGRIDVPPQNMVSISAPLGGYLKSTNLLPGMHVQKGQVLAVLEDQQYIQLQQDYLAGSARIKYLRTEYERQKSLNSSKSVSDKTYQQAEADFLAQQVAVGALAEKLLLAGINPNHVSADRISRSVNIYSPISGYVSRVNVNIGKYLAPTEVLFDLINPSDIHLALKVFEKDLDNIRKGQQVLAFTNSRPERKLACEVILVSKDLSPERTAEVHCHFQKYEHDLLPGTFMNAELALESRNATVLPDDAIVSFDGKEYIFIPEKDGFTLTAVQTGHSENGVTEILSPVNLRDTRCVTKGAYSLLMFLKNRPDQ